MMNTVGIGVRQAEIEIKVTKDSPVTFKVMCVCPHVCRLGFKWNEAQVGASETETRRALESRAKEGEEDATRRDNVYRFRI
jgi:hypothetical protein